VARTRTRLQIEDAARALADQVVGGVVTQAQAIVMIDQSVAELWDLLTQAEPTRYLAAPNEFTATAGTLEYDLDTDLSITDFMKVMGVDLKRGTQYYALDRFEWKERNDDVLSTPFLPWVRSSIRYTIRKGAIDGSTESLVFSADPGADTYRLWYIQAPQLLATDAATFNGIAGYEDFVIYDVAAKMATKEEALDLAAMMRGERDRVAARALTLARERDAAMPRRVHDSRGQRSRHGLRI